MIGLKKKRIYNLYTFVLVISFLHCVLTNFIFDSTQEITFVDTRSYSYY